MPKGDNEDMERPIVYMKRALVEISALIAGFVLFVIATAILTSYLFRGGREGTLTLPTHFMSWLPFFVLALLACAIVVWQRRKIRTR